MSRRRCSLGLRLPLVLPFAAFSAALFSGPLAAAAPQDCVEVSKVCADSADRVISGQIIHRECWRWESRFRCRAPHPDAHRCDAGSLPADCAAETPVCREAAEDGTCLSYETPLLCTSKPSGPGIEAGKPRVSVAYSTKDEPPLPAGVLGVLDFLRSSAPATSKSGSKFAGDSHSASGSSSVEGCRIVSRTCEDDAPRRIPVSNLPGETAEAAPACWRERIDISCPAAEAAASCQKLEAAGCRPAGEKACEVRDASGACLRWSAAYVCTGAAVDGDGIVVDGSIEVPDGGIVEDPSECNAGLRDAQAAGLACEEVEKACVKPGRTETGADGSPVVLPCAEWAVSYRCTGEGRNGCAALESLAASGTCRLEEAEGEDGGTGRCDEWSADGKTCLRRTAVFRCGDGVEPAEPPGDAHFIESVEEIEAEPFDGCAGYAADQGCAETASVCAEGPGIKLVDGKLVYKDCWAWEKTYACRTPGGLDECAPYASNPDCRLLSETCPEEDLGCARPVRVYECRTEGTATVLGRVCDGLACIEGVCAPSDGEADEDFVSAIVSAEIGREAGLYGDVAGNRFFEGRHLSCKDRRGAPSCCRAEVKANMDNGSAFGLLLSFGVSAGWEAVKYAGSPYVYDLLSWSDNTSWLLTKLYGTAGSGVYSPKFSYWGVSAAYSEANGFSFNFSPAMFAASAAIAFWQHYSTCDAEDQEVAMARGQRLCRYVGSTCEKSVGGLGCVETAQHYVCFNSRLARILNEEGREQLGRGWGAPDSPDARGFTVEELEALDFTQMDLSEFVADVVKEAAKHAEGITADEAAARAEERIEEMLAGKLGITSPVAGSTGKLRDPESDAVVSAGPNPNAPSASDAARSFRRPALEHPSWGPYAADPRQRRAIRPDAPWLRAAKDPQKENSK